MIAIKIIDSNNNVYQSSREMVFQENSNNSFHAQYLRDIDLSFIEEEGNRFIVEIYTYPKDVKYLKVWESKSLKLIGKYKLNVNIKDEEEVFGMKKGKIEQSLNPKYNLSIELKTIYDKQKNYYIISHPFIKGSMELLK